jgi:hypothetical protein
MPQEAPKSQGRFISVEAGICLVVALVNLALDQADIHIMLISWLSVLGCIVLCVDMLRRTKWVKHPDHGRKRLAAGSGAIFLAFVAFGIFLSFHKKAVAETKVETAHVMPAPSPPPDVADSAPTRAPVRKPRMHLGKSEDRKTTSAPALPSVVNNNAPGGIANSGTIKGDATVNNYVKPNRTLTKETLERLGILLMVHRATISVDTRNPTGDTVEYATSLCSAFRRGQWGVNITPNITLAPPDVDDNGPIAIPRGVNLYGVSETDPLAVFVKDQLAQVGIDSYIHKCERMTIGSLKLFVGAPE